MKKIEHILLIDDDQDDRYFFATALGEVDPGMRLSTASDGHDAFDKLKDEKPDLILLDMVMPGMNGMAFLTQVKAMEHLKNIPVVIYTSDMSIFAERDVLRLGAERVIIKAPDYSGTLEIISSLLDLSPLRQSA